MKVSGFPLVVGIIFDFLQHNSVAALINDEDRLYKALFGNYNRKVRPLYNTSMSVDVTVSYVINSLMDIKEKEEMMLTVGFLKVIWYDEFLVWDPVEYGNVKRLILPANSIWLPDIAISNSVSRYYDITYKRDFHVHISYTGRVRWSFGGVFSTSCRIHLNNYPFDSQNCYIEIENWMYSVQDVNMSLHESEPIVTSQLGPNTLWQLDSSQATRMTKYEDFASLRFTLVWTRKSLYYCINIVIPVVLMMMVTLGVYWLPAECGEKMTLAISIVVAFSVFLIVIMESTPVNSDAVPKITKLVMVVMTLSTTSLLISMFVVYMSGNSNRSPPKWLMHLSNNFLAKCLYMQDTTPGKDDNESHGDIFSKIFLPRKSKFIKNHMHRKVNGVNQRYRTVTEVDIKIVQISSSLQEIMSIMENKESANSTKEEWKFVGKIIDRLGFWLTLLTLTVSLICIFVV